MSADRNLNIMRLKSVLERTGLSRSTLYRKVRDRTFPRALRISVRCIGWRESDVEAWLQNPETYPVVPLRRDLLELD